jgi:hypothetical protein
MAAAQILPLPELSPADELPRAERRRIIDSALGTTLAEGVSPGPEVIAMSERYVAGEISLLELGTAVRSMSGL